MIPLNKPAHVGTELAAIAEVLTSHTSGNGKFTQRCEARLRQMHGGTPTLVVTSCTHAMEMAALLLEVKPGDEVILPSFTFVSTANAFILRGARPVFADVDQNGNILPDEVERLISARTRAIAAVHYAGNACDMDALLAVAGRVPVMEDAAQSLTSTYKGRPLGAIGALGAISFHETKNVGCGEGGALVIRDQNLFDRAEYIREKGTNRRQFIDGIVDKYTWVDVGSSYVLSELNAAYLWTQLEHVEQMQARRRSMFARYETELASALARIGAYIISPSHDVNSNRHLFGIVFREAQQRQAFIAHMREAKIATPFHYIPLHSAPMGQRLHDGRVLPNTDRISACLVRLPLYFNLTDDEQGHVISAAQRFLAGVNS